MTSTSKLTYLLILFFIMILIGLAVPSPIGRAQTGDTYPIVDTGQDKCYNANGTEITCPAKGAAFYGQDAQTLIQPVRRLSTRCLTPAASNSS